MPRTPARAVASQDICSVERPFARMFRASTSSLVPLSRLFDRGRGTPGRATLAVGSGSPARGQNEGIQEDEMSEAMHATARELVAPGKGILAADESTGTIKKRFDQIGVGSTEDLRRRYRQMLFTTPGLGENISGVILFDETIRQATDDGVPFVKVLEAAGSIPGIKVDTGAKPMALFPGETVTEGLDGLRERLAEYVQLGARFAKRRATILIGDGTPTDYAISANGHAMARYAALCQEAEIVPIVEPEILMDGDHDIAACEDATARTLETLYQELAAARVDLAGSLLKVNMVVPGKGNPT